MERNPRIGAIHGRSPEPCLPVDRPARQNEGGEIGDGVTEANRSPLQVLEGHGLIEIEGIGRIDGHEGDRTQVLAVVVATTPSNVVDVDATSNRRWLTTPRDRLLQ